MYSGMFLTLNGLIIFKGSRESYVFIKLSYFALPSLHNNFNANIDKF